MPAAASACGPALRLVAGRQVSGRPGGEADPPMPEPEQVLGRELPGRPLVDADRGDVERRRVPFTNTSRAPSAAQPGVVRVIGAKIGHLARDEDHAVDAPLEQHTDVLGLRAGRPGGVAEDRGVARFGGARCSIACASAGKIGLPSSGTSSPTIPVEPAPGERRGARASRARPARGWRPDAGRAGRDARSGRDTNSCTPGDVSKCSVPVRSPRARSSELETTIRSLHGV